LFAWHSFINAAATTTDNSPFMLHTVVATIVHKITEEKTQR
jgi:hypothetical protein